MAKNRELAEKEAIYFISKFLPGSPNDQVYIELFERMSADDFEEWIKAIEEDRDIMALFAPNLQEQTLQMNTIYAIADELEYELFQHVILTDQQTGQTYRTANKHLVGIVPFRRQVQMLVKKASIPSSNHIVDQRTGQPTGESKGARLSAPELQVNASKGLHDMIREMIKCRGGDEAAYLAMNRSIVETGEASINSIMTEFDTTVKSNKTLSVYLKAQHLNNNLV